MKVPNHTAPKYTVSHGQLTVIHLIKNGPVFMAPCTKRPATGPYPDPEPVESSSLINS
jgi:hypothetical protein